MRESLALARPKWRLRTSTLKAVTYGALILLSVPFFVPFAWLFLASFKTAYGVLSPSVLPSEWHWDNFVEVFRYQPFALQLFNSLYIATAVTVLTLILSTLTGYALARFRFPGRNVILLGMLSVLLMPSEVTIIPNYTLMQKLQLLNTPIPLILLPTFGAGGVFGAFLMRQFYLNFPAELEEAARLDGLTRFGVLLKIAAPLARPILGGLAIITFLLSWNLFLEPFIFISNPKLFTVPVALANFTDAYGAPIWNLQLAAVTISVVPMLGIYLLADRYINEALAHTVELS